MNIVRKIEVTEEEYSALKEAVYHYINCEQHNWRNEEIKKTIDVCERLHREM